MYIHATLLSIIKKKKSFFNNICTLGLNTTLLYILFEIIYLLMF